jgi:hypothetical protein
VKTVVSSMDGLKVSLLGIKLQLKGGKNGITNTFS